MPRISGKDAEGLMAAYAKVHAPKEEVAAEEPIAEAPTEEISEQLSGAQQAQQMAKDRIAAGRNTVTGELKSKPQAQKMAGGQGNRQMPVKTGGIQLGKAIKGGLGRLGSLAGRAVGAVKQGVQKVAGALSNKGPIQGRQTGTQRRAQQGQQGQSTSQATPTGQATPTAAQTAAAKADTTSPAAKAGLSSDMRAQAAANNANFQANRPSPSERAQARLAAMKNKGRPLLRNNYDLIDDTVNFLISEGYVQNEKEALSIMSESEFLEGFDEGMKQVINESSENNK